MISDKSGVPVNEARMVNIPAISIPMYGIRFKIPVISPNSIKLFDTNNIGILVNTDTTIISIIRPET
jgi:hypothetical protein